MCFHVVAHEKTNITNFRAPRRAERADKAFLSSCLSAHLFVVSTKHQQEEDKNGNRAAGETCCREIQPPTRAGAWIWAGRVEVARVHGINPPRGRRKHTTSARALSSCLPRLYTTRATGALILRCSRSHPLVLPIVFSVLSIPPVGALRRRRRPMCAVMVQFFRTIQRIAAGNTCRRVAILRTCPTPRYVAPLRTRRASSTRPQAARRGLSPGRRPCGVAVFLPCARGSTRGVRDCGFLSAPRSLPPPSSKNRRCRTTKSFGFAAKLCASSDV